MSPITQLQDTPGASLESRMPRERNQTQKATSCDSIHLKCAEKVNAVTGSKSVVARAWREVWGRNKERPLMGTVSFGGDENALELERDDGCATS